MANSKNVSRLTKEELAQASASLFGVPQKKSVPAEYGEKQKQRTYLSKLSNKEIVELVHVNSYHAILCST